MVKFQGFRGLALAAAVVMAFSAPLSAAEDEVAPPSYEELLAAALAGDPEARGALMALFNEVRGDSTAIAKLAVELIGALAGDPVEVIDAATLIADVATQVLTTQPIVRVSVGDGLELPPGAMGWDFGAPDSPAFKGFHKVTSADQEIVPGATGGLQRPGGKGLLSDGLLNIQRFLVQVPDGTYRLILLTDASGNLTLANPLGQAIMVNGLRVPMPGGSPDTWQGNGVLGGAQGAGGGLGTGAGGAIVLTVEVVNGQLVLEFLPMEGQQIFLTGVILEPVEGPSVLEMPGVFADVEEILFAEAIIAQAIGEALETIATAAGDEGERDAILDLGDAATEEGDAVSPS